eukprot:1114747-Amorphochlora_amoeboformis.AAC.2
MHKEEFDRPREAHPGRKRHVVHTLVEGMFVTLEEFVITRKQAIPTCPTHPSREVMLLAHELPEGCHHYCDHED